MGLLIFEFSEYSWLYNFLISFHFLIKLHFEVGLLHIHTEPCVFQKFHLHYCITSKCTKISHSINYYHCITITVDDYLIDEDDIFINKQKPRLLRDIDFDIVPLF